MGPNILKIGDVYIEKGDCPKCGSDLECYYGVSVMCINWQHPTLIEWYYEGGKRNCDYALMSG